MPAVKTVYDGSIKMFQDMDISPSDETGLETVMYVGDRGLPWWQEIGSKDQGKFQVRVLSQLATLDEALAASGTDWEVEQKPIYVGRKGALIEDKVANVRVTDGKALGVVSPKYRIIQNRDAFAFAENLVDTSEAKYETAGSLFGGRVVFLSMEVDHLDIAIAGRDEVDELRMYLLLINSHDASRPLRAMVTPVRVVCKNTEGIALPHALSTFAIRHTGSTDGKLQMAREALGITFKYQAVFKEAAEAMASRSLVDSQVEEIFRNIWPVPEDITEGRLDSHPSTVAFENYIASDTLDGIRGTGWGAFNAVTEYLDHVQQYRSRGNTAADVRADSLLFGRSAQVRQRAFQLLVKA